MLRKLALPFVIIILFSVLGSAVEITAWVTYKGVTGSILTEMIETDFTTSTGIEVNYQSYPADATFLQKALLAIDSGDAPDVMTLGVYEMDCF